MHYFFACKGNCLLTNELALISSEETLEKPILKASYPLMEDFYTLQGEGFHQGKAAYFIRLGGCDVGCHWCDVKESWPAEAHPRVKVGTLLERMQDKTARLAVVTGGEPTLYDLGPLTTALQEAGFRTHIETSGAHPLTGHWDWVTLSPKKFKAPLPEVYPKADELKIIIYNQSDFRWAEEHAEKVGSDCQLLLQPEWSKRNEMMPLMVDYIQDHPEWQMCLQTHKYIGVD